MRFLISSRLSFSSSDTGREWPASLPESLGGGDELLEGKIQRAQVQSPHPTKITLPTMRGQLEVAAVPGLLQAFDGVRDVGDDVLEVRSNLAEGFG